MKKFVYKNIYNGEEVICNDPKLSEEIIEGVKYLRVYKNNPTRSFLMRKDSLALVSKTSKIV